METASISCDLANVVMSESAADAPSLREAVNFVSFDSLMGQICKPIGHSGFMSDYFGIRMTSITSRQLDLPTALNNNFHRCNTFKRNDPFLC